MINEALFAPLVTLFGVAAAGISVLAVAFWIWMIVDAAQRNYKNDTEKIVWVLIVVLANFIGALVYFLVIRISNPKGVITKNKR